MTTIVFRTFAAKLKQPQLPQLWLELARFRVKADAYSRVELGEMLDAMQNLVAHFTSSG